MGSNRAIEMGSEELGGNKEEMLQAYIHVWNHIFHFVNSMSLKCAIQLGIPDVIHNHGKPITISELVDALPIHPTKALHIHRLVRNLVQNGFLKQQKILDKIEEGLEKEEEEEEEEEEEGYVLTNASLVLLEDNPLSVTPFLLATLDPILTEPWHYLNAWFRNEDPTPFGTAHGKTLWDFCGQDPKLNFSFNEGLASDCRLISYLVLRDYKGIFEGLKCLVDVGGGTGTMAKAIAKAFPGLSCIVLDLPHVIANLNDNDNLTYVGGDMFQGVPEADAILLKSILHDWNDEECVKILKHCKEAVKGKKGGKVIIIEMVLQSKEGNNVNRDDGLLETQLNVDMMMMTLVTGRERNEKEWAQLFRDAGFNKYIINPISGVRSLIEVFP